MDDLFAYHGVAEPEQPKPEPVPQKQPLTAADVRQMMVDIIAALESPDPLPYTPAELKKHKGMFPIMAMWLDAEDAADLTRQFDAALARRTAI